MVKKFSYTKAMAEHKKGRELIGIIKRLGGGKKEHKKMYDWIKFGKKP